MNIQCSGGSRSFSKAMRALKMRTVRLAIISWQWQIERIIEADPLTIIREVAEELSIDHSMVIGQFKQIGKVKSSISGCHMKWSRIKKIIFWSDFFYSTQQQWTISQSDCDVRWKVDFIWQPEMTSSVVGLRKSFKALLKAKLAP